MIKYIDNCKTFHLSGESFSYIFKVNAHGYLQHMHFGAKVLDDDLTYLHPAVERGFCPCYPGDNNRNESPDSTQAEFPAYGMGDFRLSALLTINTDGNRTEHLKYKCHSISKKKPPIEGMPSLKTGETLTVTLASKSLEVRLFYTVYEKLGTVARRAEVTNISKTPIKVERFGSMSLDLPSMDYDLITLHGKHCGERQLERMPLRHGVQSVSSLRGASSHQLNPFIALVSKDCGEHSGEAYGVNLIYGGNFSIQTECDQCNTTRIFSGFAETDFSWHLAGGASLASPETVLVYSQSGLGGMSRNLHDLYRTQLINKSFVNSARPIVINSWEAFYFWFDTEKLCGLIKSCAGLGIDTFVLDDGWFGKRDSDRSGLGDWFVNTDKLKGGLKPIIDCCRENGLKFGLWFEPEMVSEDSDLYRAHPDWAIRVPTLPHSEGRSQMVLDLSRTEVVDYLKATISDILKNNDIAYVKWDFNRHITDAYSVALPPMRRQEIWHRYMLGFYELARHLTETFPKVLFEGCSGGGGRFDPSMLPYFPQIWTSDNSDAYARTRIQYGTSLAYPLSSMTGHVSVCPNHQTGRITPFTSRAIMASNCHFGYELNVAELTETEREQIRRQTDEYKSLVPLIAEGDLYRLISPFEKDSFAFLIVSKSADRAVLSYLRPLAECNAPVTRIKLKGLAPDKTYFIKELNLTLKGATLLNAGVPLQPKTEDFAALRYTLEEVK